MTVDTTGQVWLVEVKFNYSPESGGRVWRDQLVRYRRALMCMNWADIVSYTRAFLFRQEKTSPQFAHRSDAASLQECIEEWLSAKGADPGAAPNMVGSIAARLRDGSFGVLLVTDYVNNADLAEAARFATEVHAGPVAYAVVEPDDCSFRWNVLFHRAEASTFSAISQPVASPLAKAAQKTTPARLLELASPGSRTLLESVVYPRLAALGWSPDACQAKRSAFDALIPIGEVSVPLLVVGTSELDARSVERALKMEGGQSIKINPRMKAVLTLTGDMALVNRYMKRFHALGWRGRPRGGKDLTWGITDISAEEVLAAEAAMIYSPSLSVRDHCGRPEDAANLNSFFDVFADFVAEIRNSVALRPPQRILDSQQ